MARRCRSSMLEDHPRHQSDWPSKRKNTFQQWKRKTVERNVSGKAHQVTAFRCNEDVPNLGLDVLSK